MAVDYAINCWTRLVRKRHRCDKNAARLRQWHAV